ncbi:hypothetical protein HDU84_007469 [Entophlyctis sp. JEL0112]|nr:hypothetical protein HDU84_007469 [Entophlyctis sp. JEL0112]
MDYHMRWCLVCERQIEVGCARPGSPVPASPHEGLYCSPACLRADFRIRQPPKSATPTRARGLPPISVTANNVSINSNDTADKTKNNDANVKDKNISNGLLAHVPDCRSPHCLDLRSLIIAATPLPLSVTLMPSPSLSAPATRNQSPPSTPCAEPSFASTASAFSAQHPAHLTEAHRFMQASAAATRFRASAPLPLTSPKIPSVARTKSNGIRTSNPTADRRLTHGVTWVDLHAYQQSVLAPEFSLEFQSRGGSGGGGTPVFPDNVSQISSKLVE